MATQTIDPKALKSWEDAFREHPLPAVRRLEQQLRRNVSENREKLRALVGASYRDLLGTAERIIEMDAQMGAVERNLSSIGRKCNARAVEQCGENYGKLERVKRKTVMKVGATGFQEGEGDKIEIVVRTKLLQNALGVAARTIKSGADPLLAAKLLILARLLHKSTAESANPPRVLENLRRKLSLLRKKLLAYIDRSLVVQSSEHDFLVHTLCAYALVTSSAPKDVMRHFMDVRLESINDKCEKAASSELDRVEAALDVYGQTLTVAKELFPRRFADAMTSIAKVPLLQEDQLRDIPALSLDIYESWIPETIRSFTPYIRHDQLTTANVNESIRSWVKEAQQSLLNGLKQHLSSRNDVSSIVDARAAYLSKVAQLAQPSHAPDHMKLLQDARQAFLERLRELAVQISRPHESMKVIEASKSANGATVARQSLWDLSEQDIDLDGGALELRQSVLRLRHGHDSSVDRYTSLLGSWLEDICAYMESLKAMRSQKWKVDLDLDFDTDSDGDENGTDMQRILNKDDPSELQTALQRVVRDALKEVYAGLAEAPSTEGATPTLIRVTREVDITKQQLNTLFEMTFDEMASASFIGRLHQQIASQTIAQTVEKYTESLQRKSPPAVALWDGTPPLPIQPSPAIFRLLSDVHHRMSSGLEDIWSPAAVTTLKKELARQTAEALQQSASLKLQTDEPVTNGDPEDERADESSVAKTSEKDRLVQLLFDLLYLQRALGFSGSNRDIHDIAGAIDELKTITAVDKPSIDRLAKNADSYWKRTFLLFGLLAPEPA